MLTRNGLYGISSTALSGLSNLIVQLFVASGTDADRFGEFAIASSTVIFLLGLARAVIGQTDMLRGGRRADSRPIGTAYVIAFGTLVIGMALSAIGSLLSYDLVSTLGCSVAISSVFILQDSARFRCFRMQRSLLALVSDSVVFASAVGGLLLLDHLGAVADGALWIWGGATLAGFLTIVVPLKYYPRFAGDGSRGWLSEHRDLTIPSAGEYILQAGVPYALNWLVLAVGGFSALAGYRLIQLLFAGISNLAQGMNAVTLPQVVNAMDPVLAVRVLRQEAVIITIASGAAFAVLVGMPESAGLDLFGSSWQSLGLFLVPGSLHGLANALSVPIYSSLRLLGYARFSLVVRACSVLATLSLAALGAVLWEAPGIAWGIALVASAAYIVRLLTTVASLRRLIRDGDGIRVIESPQAKVR
jgi:hypothetical protein